MTKEREIEILMLDRCTKSDAEKHLKNGSTVFEGDDFEKFFDDYMKEWNIEEEDIEEYRKMITDKIPVRDWGIVEDNGETYYIMYVLQSLRQILKRYLPFLVQQNRE